MWSHPLRNACPCCCHPSDAGPVALPAQPLPSICHAALLFLQLALGVAMPTLLSAYFWHPGLEGSQDAEDGALVMPRVAHLQHLAAPHIVFFRTLRISAISISRKAAAAADQALRAMLHARSGAAVRAVACWWALALCWLLSAQLAGLRTVF